MRERRHRIDPSSTPNQPEFGPDTRTPHHPHSSHGSTPDRRESDPAPTPKQHATTTSRPCMGHGDPKTTAPNRPQILPASTKSQLQCDREPNPPCGGRSKRSAPRGARICNAWRRATARGSGRMAGRKSVPDGVGATRGAGISFVWVAFLESSHHHSHHRQRHHHHHHHAVALGGPARRRQHDALDLS